MKRGYALKENKRAKRMSWSKNKENEPQRKTKRVG